MKTKNFLLFFFLIGILFTACNKEDETVVKNGEVYGDEISIKRLLDAVNHARTNGYTCEKDGAVYPPVDKVVWNDTLAKSAYDHSKDMKLNNFFSHTGSDGSNCGNRALKNKYKFYILGENIAKGNFNEEQVVDAWLKSPGHCKNIMNPKFEEMGISKLGLYWTQVLGKK